MEAKDIALIIGALGLFVTQIITAWRNGAKVDAARTDAAQTAVQTDGQLKHITTLTNSNWSEAMKRLDDANARLDAANARIAKLEELLTRASQAAPVVGA